MIDRAIGVYEYWKTNQFINLIEPNMTVLDIGANKGYYSLLAARLSHDSGRVLSFEPDPANCDWIAKAIAANGYKSVTLFPIAIANTNGTATFYRARTSGGGTIISKPDRQKPSIEVMTKCLDDFLDDRDILSEIDVVKIDVEGAELLVLQGAERMLNTNQKLRLLIDIHGSYLGEKVFQLLKSHGFQLFSIGREQKTIFDSTAVGTEMYAVKIRV